VYSFHAGLLKDEQLKLIPNSTLSYWRSFDHKEFFGYQWVHDYIETDIQMKDVAKRKVGIMVIRFVIRSLFIIPLLSMKSRYLLIFLILICSFHGFGQQRKVDSLQKVLNNKNDDTARLRIYLALSDACDLKDNLKYGEPAVQLCDKLLAQTADEKTRKALLKQKLQALNVCSYFYSQMRDTSSKAFESFEKQLKIYQELKDTENTVNFSMECSSYSERIGNFPKAIEYCQYGMAVAQKLHYKKGISMCMFRMVELYGSQGENDLAIETLQKCLATDSTLNGKPIESFYSNYITRDYASMGSIYNSMHDTAKALLFFHKALSIAENKCDKYGQVQIYGHMAKMYRDNNDFTNALSSYQRILTMAQASGSIAPIPHFKDWTAIALDAIGDVYIGEGKTSQVKNGVESGDSLFRKALDFHSRALMINEELKSSNMAESKFGLARTYYYLKNYSKAKDYCDQYLSYHLLPSFRKDAELFKAKIDSSSGDYKDAYTHYLNYIFLRDKLNGEEVKNSATKEKFQNEYDKQKAFDKVEQDKKEAQQRIIVWSILCGLLLVLIFAGFIFRSLRITRKQKEVIEIKSKETEEQKQLIEKQKELVEERNKDILDSITYAKRLQDAILPPLSIIKQYLPDSFLLYKPKDIVAGDFYWMERTGDNILIAAADCTGHGVPGALVSVVCSNALNRTVKEFHVTEPGRILDKVRELVLETFEKSESNVQDGMDISLCFINTKKNEVQWSGAYNSLWYIQNGEIHEVPADKQPIGKHDKPVPFNTHNLNLQKGDTLYLFTDGFADQFGGPKGKKFKYKQMEELLLTNATKSMDEQKNVLEHTLESWKGNLEQVDDILVIGIKI